MLRHPVPARHPVACTGTANLFGSMGTALEIVFLIRVLRIRPADTGLLIAVASLGGVAGGPAGGPAGPPDRLGPHHLVLDARARASPSCSSRWPRPAGASPPSRSGWRSSPSAAVVYNVAQVSYRQAICPPRLLGRMNAAVRWVVWGTIPLGGVLGGALGTLAGVRVTLWIAYAGSWAAGWWVFFSPLRRQRDLEAQRDPAEQRDPEGQPDPEEQRDLQEQADLEDHRAPGSGIPGQGGRELPGRHRAAAR